MPRTLVTTQTFRPTNILINGLFDHWQRATTAGAGGTPAYNTTDRWMNELSGSGSISFDRSTIVPNSTMRFSMQLSKGTAATGTRLNQRIEADNIAPYIGKTVCFSFWIRLQSGTLSGASLIVRNALTKDTWTADNTTEPTVWTETVTSQIAAAGVWKRIYSSFVVTPDCVNGMSTQLQFNVATDFVLQVAGCMLTEGSTPPMDTYRHAENVGLELAACQRYFYSPNFNATDNSPYGVGYASTTSVAHIVIPFPVPMRIQAALANDSSNQIRYPANSTTAVTSMSIGETGTTSALMVVNTAAVLTAGTGVVLRKNGSGYGSFIHLSAEL